MRRNNGSDIDDRSDSDGTNQVVDVRPNGAHKFTIRDNFGTNNAFVIGSNRTERSRSPVRDEAINSRFSASAIVQSLRNPVPVTSPTVLAAAKAAVKKAFPKQRPDAQRLQNLVTPIAEAVREDHFTKAAFAVLQQIAPTESAPLIQQPKVAAKAKGNAPPKASAKASFSARAKALPHVKPVQPKRNTRAKPRGF
eukprot:GEMP01106559.1.p1 GENE.GEMP01106559.1~~GEMP01106559.1.p1  ORF type:complete len:210 (+),score=36.39 GEMP01106559.1:46-630(+)